MIALMPSESANSSPGKHAPTRTSHSAAEHLLRNGLLVWQQWQPTKRIGCINTRRLESPNDASSFRGCDPFTYVPQVSEILFPDFVWHRLWPCSFPDLGSPSWQRCRPLGQHEASMDAHEPPRKVYSVILVNNNVCSRWHKFLDCEVTLPRHPQFEL